MKTDNFPTYYTRLFNGITDAIQALDQQNILLARHILVRSQQDAEETYRRDTADAPGIHQNK